MADSKSSEPNRARNRGDTVPSAVSRSAARRDRWRRPWLILLAGLAASLAGATARALTSVDCDTPDDFCTGDPCVTADNIEITVPACVLDFGARALVLAKVVFVPNDGTLSLTAGSIEVDRRIDGQHVDATEGDGADISLIATGNITLKGRVDAAGRTTTGAIVLDAGGDIDLRDQVRSRAKGHGATATGGTVTIEADGTVTSVKKGKVDVRGKRNHTPAGQATISGQAGVSLGGQVDVRGNPGGSAVISSSLGDVVIGDKVRGEGMPGGGGSITASAAGNLTVNKIIKAPGGPPSGGTIALMAGTAGAIVTKNIRVNGIGAPAGTVAATGGSVSMRIIQFRGFSGGVVDIASTSGDVGVYRLMGEAKTGAGGTVTIDSALNLELRNGAKLEGVAGGTARFTSVGDMSLGTSSGKKFDVTGTTGGLIEGQAGGNLTAQGKFLAAVGGCVGLSAGGTLDTSGATFDVPLTGSCP